MRELRLDLHSKARTLGAVVSSATVDPAVRRELGQCALEWLHLAELVVRINVRLPIIGAKARLELGLRLNASCVVDVCLEPVVGFNLAQERKPGGIPNPVYGQEENAEAGYMDVKGMSE